MEGCALALLRACSHYRSKAGFWSVFRNAVLHFLEIHPVFLRVRIRPSATQEALKTRRFQGFSLRLLGLSQNEIDWQITGQRRALPACGGLEGRRYGTVILRNRRFETAPYYCPAVNLPRRFWVCFMLPNASAFRRSRRVRRFRLEGSSSWERPMLRYP